MSVTATHQPISAAVAIPRTRYVTLVAGGAAVGGYLFGFDTSTMNAAIVGVRSDLRLSAATVGLVGAIALIGCAIGAWFAGPMSTRFGRNRVMLIGGALVAAGSIGAALVAQVALIAACRIGTGLGIGALSAVVPGYIAEISPPRIRGRLGSLWQLGIVFGQLLGLLAGYCLTRLAGSESSALPWGGTAWRWMFACDAFFGLIYVAITRGLPRSPADLVRQGHIDEARALLPRLGSTEPKEQLSAIEDSLAKTKHEVATLGDLGGGRFLLKAIVWTGILLAAFQQLVGISVVKTYSNALWQAVGFSSGTAFLISILTVLVSIASTLVAIAIIDRVGRRKMLVTGAAVMTISLAVLALCFATTHTSAEDVSLSGLPAIGALVSINAFAVAFGITWGPVMWVMIGELFDSRLRNVAMAVCVAVNWMTNWAVTRTFPLLASLGLGFAYGLYAGFAAVAFVFAIRRLPETRGRVLA
ncbi:MAG TPA: sugar porter family MFS transporter [Gemmatimonadaceae bacterium]|nr:sugar porter family MFS transporter [Gemmatimonadaceae bacterium]